MVGNQRQEDDMPATIGTRDSFFEETSCQDPPLYLAKSTHGDGWGVFSRFPVREGQFVELAPMFLRFHEDDPNTEGVLKDTALNNYHYEYGPSQFVLSFGYMLYFNHSSSRPNIKYCQLGSEPDVDNLDNTVGLGYYALCNIDAHVELLCDYGGSEWFQDRGLDLVEESMDCSGAMQSLEKESDRLVLCSKAFGGFGDTHVQRVIECHGRNCDGSAYDLSSLHIATPFPKLQVDVMPVSTGFGNVRSRQNAKAGDTLETDPVLLLPKQSVNGSLLEIVIMNWQGLKRSKDIALLTKTKVMICQESDNNRSSTKVTSSFKEMNVNDTVILPLAGNLSLIERKPTDFNAQLIIEQDPYNEFGFLLRLVATTSVAQGEKITVNLPSLSRVAVERLVEELAMTGQPVPADLDYG